MQYVWCLNNVYRVLSTHMKYKVSAQCVQIKIMWLEPCVPTSNYNVSGALRA